mmetsp:Transcript_6429/g.13220  ORF Transcript_6429/g.13220 Transcript_6429/m.13220 type:complete len:105 (-) Transcript_6429:71-385(-)
MIRIDNQSPQDQSSSKSAAMAKQQQWNDWLLIHSGSLIRLRPGAATSSSSGMILINNWISSMQEHSGLILLTPATAAKLVIRNVQFQIVQFWNNSMKKYSKSIL